MAVSRTVHEVRWDWLLTLFLQNFRILLEKVLVFHPRQSHEIDLHGLIIVGGILIFLDKLIVSNQIDELDLNLGPKVFGRFKLIHTFQGVVDFSINWDYRYYVFKQYFMISFLLQLKEGFLRDACQRQESPAELTNLQIKVREHKCRWQGRGILRRDSWDLIKLAIVCDHLEKHDHVASPEVVHEEEEV